MKSKRVILAFGVIVAATVTTYVVKKTSRHLSSSERDLAGISLLYINEIGSEIVQVDLSTANAQSRPLSYGGSRLLTLPDLPNLIIREDYAAWSYGSRPSTWQLYIYCTETHSIRSVPLSHVLAGGVTCDVSTSGSDKFVVSLEDYSSFTRKFGRLPAFLSEAGRWIMQPHVLLGEYQMIEADGSNKAIGSAVMLQDWPQHGAQIIRLTGAWFALEYDTHSIAIINSKTGRVRHIGKGFGMTAIRLK